jgi:hypothetical protein
MAAFLHLTAAEGILSWKVREKLLSSLVTFTLILNRSMPLNYKYFKQFILFQMPYDSLSYLILVLCNTFVVFRGNSLRLIFHYGAKLKQWLQNFNFRVPEFACSRRIMISDHKIQNLCPSIRYLNSAKCHCFLAAVTVQRVELTKSAQL